jgi:hypothetical protein
MFSILREVIASLEDFLRKNQTEFKLDQGVNALVLLYQLKYDHDRNLNKNVLATSILTGFASYNVGNSIIELTT